MRTRNIFRYLLAIIIALGTTVNVFAQEKTMKIYFKQNPYNTENNNIIPPLTKEDIILRGDIPFTGVDLKPEPEGVVWASGYRWFSGWHGTAKDRIIASYVDSNTKMDSRLKLSFKNFPFEVNAIQWNAMNDLLSGAIFDITEWDSDIFDNYKVKYAYTPISGNAITGSEQHWDMNIFSHSMDFNQGDMPGASNIALNGLSSLEFQEENYFKIGIGSLITFYSRKTALNDNCRTFIKAGFDGKTEPGTNDWAFNIKYYLPELALRFADGRANNVVYVNEPTQKNVQLQANISAHQGAITPISINSKPKKGDYYYEFVSGNTSILKIDDPRTGKIVAAYKSGSVDVTVNLKYMLNDNINDASIISSNTQTVYVLEEELGSDAPEICIGFRNGYKGYDVTVGDTNVKIEGFLTKGTKPTNSTFEYSEGSNGQIITINKTTGTITPLKEGDVTITAVLKSSNGAIVSYPYSYTLHVFAENEGLEWKRVNTYTYSDDPGLLGLTVNKWKVTTTSSNASYDWKSQDLLKVKTSINNTDGWKQIVSFHTTSANYWRAICEEIQFDIKVPKYSTTIVTYPLAGNVAIGDAKPGWIGAIYDTDGDCKYGFEVKDLGNVSANEADTRIKSIEWKTNNQASSSDPTNYTTKIRKNAEDYVSNIGGEGSVQREVTSNKNGANPKTVTRYLAVMSYLYYHHQYPGDASFGFKGIPTYTYYSQIKYYSNYQEDEEPVLIGEETLSSEGKTATQKLNQKISVPTREGYEFLGWSTVKNGKTVVYPAQGDFCSYDTENGGGKGPVSLYAVWEPNIYTVTLDPQGGEGGTTSVTAAYGQPMPTITVPTRPGYEFYGYFAEQPGYNDNWLNGGTRYYNSDGTSAKNWDKNDNVTLYAHWKSAKYIVTFDINGGIMQEHTQYNSDASMSKLEEITDQLIKISFTYGHGGSDEITNAKPKLGGFKCVGFYDVDNVLVASVNTNPANYNITINKNNKYWKDGNWNWPHDVTFTARYEPKFTYENNVLDFGTETLEIGIDWSQGVIHDVVDAANYLMNEGSVSEDNPVMVVNLKNAKYLRGDLDAKYLKVPLENKPFFSPNLLVYLTNGFYDNNIIYDNLIFEGGGCKSLVVTDRFPIKIPYAFNASKASYARDAKVADGDKGKDQAKNSYWGTLCLPYPIRNNANGVKFYEFQRTANNYFMFEEMSDNEVIPANTPVLYCRTDYNPETVEFGSMITIEEQNVDVPKNATYKPEFISYANAHESIQDWEFRGNLKTNVFCGRGYINAPAEAIANSDITNNGEVYYFKQNKFTRLVPATTKNVNGKETHYDAGKMTLYPYRAYFYKKGVNGSPAKVSAYSILVVDEFGNTTDITNAVFGDGEGDGKIYDLNGIRVMQPVKGRLYIVNGQKKVYR